MPDQIIKFEDGAVYEQLMGIWSQSVGLEFLEWLAPMDDKNWIDIGCGNGAFTEQIKISWWNPCNIRAYSKSGKTRTKPSEQRATVWL